MRLLGKGKTKEEKKKMEEIKAAILASEKEKKHQKEPAPEEKEEPAKSAPEQPDKEQQKAKPAESAPEKPEEAQQKAKTAKSAPAKKDSKKGRREGFHLFGLRDIKKKANGHAFRLFGHKDKKEKKKKGRVKKKEHEGKPKKKPKRPAFIPRMKIVPKFYEAWVKRQLWLSGSEKKPQTLIRNIIIVSLIVGVAAGFIFRTYMMYLIPGVFIVIFGVLNAMLILSVDRRGRFVDEILPDALMLLSANIRAGYIPSRALILSARKEFGPLSVAIRKAGKEIMTGASLEEGLKEIPERIRSQDLSRTIKLIIEGVKGGGQIVTLLEENAIDIRRRQAIRKEIKANIMMYAIFIAFAGCLGAPGLYALSGYLTTTTSNLSPDISGSAQITDKVSFIQMGGVEISEAFLFQFSIAAILITTIFGGLILGLINSGREKDGLKFAPILAIIALLVFFGANVVINMMFSTILPG